MTLDEAKTHLERMKPFVNEETKQAIDIATSFQFTISRLKKHDWQEGKHSGTFYCCTNCNIIIPKESKYCLNCGAKIEKEGENK